MGTETWENGIANMGTRIGMEIYEHKMGEWERMSECECEKYRNKTWELKHWNEYGSMEK